MFFTPLRTPPPPGIYNSYRILAIFTIFWLLWVFLWGGVGGWPPTECRAGDESFGHDSPPAPMNTDLTLIRGHVFCIDTLLMLFGIQGCGGGGSVRMRNALHEVGGRSLGIDASAESASRQSNSTQLSFFIIFHHTFILSTYAHK
jgi:hypothetical protein